MVSLCVLLFALLFLPFLSILLQWSITLVCMYTYIYISMRGGYITYSNQKVHILILPCSMKPGLGTFHRRLCIQRQCSLFLIEGERNIILLTNYMYLFVHILTLVMLHVAYSISYTSSYFIVLKTISLHFLQFFIISPIGIINMKAYISLPGALYHQPSIPIQQRTFLEPGFSSIQHSKMHCALAQR